MDFIVADPAWIICALEAHFPESTVSQYLAKPTFRQSGHPAQRAECATPVYDLGGGVMAENLFPGFRFFQAEEMDVAASITSNDKTAASHINAAITSPVSTSNAFSVLSSEAEAQRKNANSIKS